MSREMNKGPGVRSKEMTRRDCFRSVNKVIHILPGDHLLHRNLLSGLAGVL